MRKIKTQDIKITDLLYKPTIEFYKEDIVGVGFIGWKQSPNVYVIRTNDVIFSNGDDGPIPNLAFTFKDLKYTLEDINITIKDELFYLECKKWREEVI